MPRMQSLNDRSRSLSSPLSMQEPDQVASLTKPLPQENGFVPSQHASDQTNMLSVQPPSFTPAVIDPLTPLPAPNVTRVLTRTLAGPGEAPVQRAPVIIRGNIKRPVGASHMPHPVRRRIVSLVGIVVLFLIISFSLLTATPLGHSIGLNFTPSKSGNTMEISNQNGNNTLNSVVAQATATAVFHKQTDGYDPSAKGGVTVSDSAGSLLWPYGQCTYWANYYYHQLSGYWVNWGGNAGQWAAGASAAGWNVSTTPHVPSIIVLAPYVQGASGYGHVAVVTSIIDSTTVLTSNMNWWAYGGGWGIVSNVDFNYGPGYYGVYFVWHP